MSAKSSFRPFISILLSGAVVADSLSASSLAPLPQLQTGHATLHRLSTEAFQLPYLFAHWLGKTVPAPRHIASELALDHSSVSLGLWARFIASRQSPSAVINASRPSQAVSSKISALEKKYNQALRQSFRHFIDLVFGDDPSARTQKTRAFLTALDSAMESARPLSEFFKTHGVSASRHPSTDRYFLNAAGSSVSPAMKMAYDKELAWLADCFELAGDQELTRVVTASVSFMSLASYGKFLLELLDSIFALGPSGVSHLVRLAEYFRHHEEIFEGPDAILVKMTVGGHPHRAIFLSNELTMPQAVSAVTHERVHELLTVLHSGYSLAKPLKSTDASDWFTSAFEKLTLYRMGSLKRPYVMGGTWGVPTMASDFREYLDAPDPGTPEKRLALIEEIARRRGDDPDGFYARGSLLGARALQAARTQASREGFEANDDYIYLLAGRYIVRAARGGLGQTFAEAFRRAEAGINESWSDPSFQAIPRQTDITFVLHRIHFPDYMLGDVLYRRWTEQEGQQLHTNSNSKKWAGLHTHIEFVSRLHPEIRLLIEIPSTHTKKHRVKATFLNLKTKWQEEELIPCGHRDRDMPPLNFEEFRTGRLFLDAAVGIPLDHGPARARGVRDWLLELDTEKQAVHREQQIGVGLWAADMKLPVDLREGRLLVKVLSESIYTVRFLMFIDALDPERFFVFETDHEGHLFDASTGERILPRSIDKFGGNLWPVDVPGLRHFLREASRVLAARGRPARMTSIKLFGQLKSDPNAHRLGMPTALDWVTIKVEGTTAVTPTGVVGTARRGDPVGTIDPDEQKAFPLLICHPSIEKPEPIPPHYENGLIGERPRYVLLPGTLKPRFLGLQSGESYTYFKRVGRVYQREGYRTLYRRLGAEDPRILAQVQMVGDEHFSIEGVRWVQGPEKGKPVLFKGHVALSAVALKYGDGRLIEVPDKIVDTFAPSTELLQSGRWHPREPLMRRLHGQWTITTGPVRTIKDPHEFADQLRTESEILNRPPANPRSHRREPAAIAVKRDALGRFIPHAPTDAQHDIINEVFRMMWNYTLQGSPEKQRRLQPLAPGDPIYDDLIRELGPAVGTLAVNVLLFDHANFTLFKSMVQQRDAGIVFPAGFFLASHPGTYRDEDGSGPHSVNLFIQDHIYERLLEYRTSKPKAYQKWLVREVAHLKDRLAHPHGGGLTEEQMILDHPVDEFIEELNDSSDTMLGLDKNAAEKIRTMDVHRGFSHVVFAEGESLSALLKLPPELASVFQVAQWAWKAAAPDAWTRSGRLRVDYMREFLVSALASKFTPEQLFAAELELVELTEDFDNRSLDDLFLSVLQKAQDRAMSAHRKQDLSNRLHDDSLSKLERFKAAYALVPVATANHFDDLIYVAQNPNVFGPGLGGKAMNKLAEFEEGAAGKAEELADIVENAFRRISVDTAAGFPLNALGALYALLNINRNRYLVADSQNQPAESFALKLLRHEREALRSQALEILHVRGWPELVDAVEAQMAVETSPVLRASELLLIASLDPLRELEHLNSWGERGPIPAEVLADMLRHRKLFWSFGWQMTVPFTKKLRTHMRQALEKREWHKIEHLFWTSLGSAEIYLSRHSQASRVRARRLLKLANYLYKQLATNNQGDFDDRRINELNRVDGQLTKAENPQVGTSFKDVQLHPAALIVGALVTLVSLWISYRNRDAQALTAVLGYFVTRRPLKHSAHHAKEVFKAA